MLVQRGESSGGWCGVTAMSTAWQKHYRKVFGSDIRLDAHWHCVRPSLLITALLADSVGWSKLGVGAEAHEFLPFIFSPTCITLGQLANLVLSIVLRVHLHLEWP